jgi:hypothetical protein
VWLELRKIVISHTTVTMKSRMENMRRAGKDETTRKTELRIAAAAMTRVWLFDTNLT